MPLARPTTTQTAAQQPEATEEQTMTQEGVQAAADQAQPEPEPQAETAQPESESTAVATQAPAQPPAQRRGAAMEQDMAEDGMEGLTVGGMSFESIRLPAEGQFVIGQEEEVLGKEFDCVVIASKARFVVRQSDDQDAEMFYSYDPEGKTNTEGVDMSEKLSDWKDDGYDVPVIKKYLEVQAILIDEDENGESGERDRMMVTLSIPPASVQKFSGFIWQQRMMRKQAQNEFITRCIVGAKVKGKNNSFYPWTFKNAGNAPELF